MKLGHSRLLNEDMSGQSCNIWDMGWVFIQFWVFIEVVHIVAYSEELLVLVRTSEKNGSDPYNVRSWDQLSIGVVSLKI